MGLCGDGSLLPFFFSYVGFGLREGFSVTVFLLVCWFWA